jgi:hypothetical protein
MFHLNMLLAVIQHNGNLFYKFIIGGKVSKGASQAQ